MQQPFRANCRSGVGWTADGEGLPPLRPNPTPTPLTQVDEAIQVLKQHNALPEVGCPPLRQSAPLFPVHQLVACFLPGDLPQTAPWMMLRGGQPLIHTAARRLSRWLGCRVWMWRTSRLRSGGGWSAGGWEACDPAHRPPCATKTRRARKANDSTLVWAFARKSARSCWAAQAARSCNQATCPSRAASFGRWPRAQAYSVSIGSH